MRINTFAEIGAGEEQLCLPTLTEIMRTQFVKFPVSTDGCYAVDLGPTQIALPAFSLYRFDSCRIDGFRLLSTNGKYFLDSSLNAGELNYEQNFLNKLQRGQTEDLVLRQANSEPDRSETRHLDQENILLFSSDEPANFGSWIYRILPKIVLSRRFCELTYLFGYASAPWMKAMIGTIFPSLSIIPQNPKISYVFKAPIIPSAVAPVAFFRQELREEYSELTERFRTGDDVPERIYVSRRRQAIKRPGVRVLENETELVERLVARGFVEFFPEDHPIEVQIRTFSQAKIIVGLGGSNMFGCYFARQADIIIDIESVETWIYAHANVLASSGRPFTIVRGIQNDRGTGGHRNWMVDVESLLRGMAALSCF
jgi:hypothetical protein